MAGIDEVLQALNGGFNPMLVMKQLKMAPCRMRAILDSPRMRQHLALQRKMARIMADLHATQNVRLAMSHLTDMASLCPNDQIALKACTAIIRQGLAAEELREPTTPREPGEGYAFDDSRQRAKIERADGQGVELKALLTVLAAVIKTGSATHVSATHALVTKQAKQVATNRDIHLREPDTADSRRVARLLHKLLAPKE